MATKTYPGPIIYGPAGGDLTGEFPYPQIAKGAIIDADVNEQAAIATYKIAGPLKAVKNNGLGALAFESTVPTTALPDVFDLSNPDGFVNGVKTIGGPAKLLALEVDKKGRINRYAEIPVDLSNLTGNAGGELSGTLGNLTVNSGVITTNKIADGAITSAKLAPNGAGGQYGSRNDTLNVTVGAGGLVTSVVSSPISIGSEDYSRGLIPFTAQTDLKRSIRQINEVLKGLAPKPPPNLCNLQSNTTTNSQPTHISFDVNHPASFNSAPYASVTNLESSLPGKGFSEVFARVGDDPAHPAYFKRLGVFSDKENISLLLNGNVSADGVNFPDSSFKVDDNGPSRIALSVNGSEVGNITFDNTVGVITNTSFFTLSVAESGRFPNGEPLDVFKHRNGTAIVPPELWVPGHNYAQTELSYDGATYITNYVDWVYDPEASVSGVAYSISPPSIGNLSVNGSKWLSGIEYYTDVNYTFDTNISNYFKNSYRDDGVTFSTPPNSGLQIAPVTVPTPSSASDVITISQLHTLTGERVLLGQSLPSTLQISNGFGKTGSATKSTGTLLIDRKNTPNTDLVENFCLEDYRVPVAAYNTQTSLQSAFFDSLATLVGTNELLVCGGALKYPSTISPDIYTAASVPSVTPDYRTLTGTRFFLRRFKNGPSVRKFGTIQILGSGINLSDGSLKIALKIPERTGWRDVLRNAPTGSYSQFADGVGCLQEMPDISVSGAYSIKFNFLLESISPNSLFVIKLETTEGWSGSITGISVIF